jgi:hypothetical protein
MTDHAVSVRINSRVVANAIDGELQHLCISNHQRELLDRVYMDKFDYRGTSTKVNPLFVAERRCEAIEQNRACTSTWMDNCRVWPNAAVPLPNVTASMLDVINNIDFIRCIPDAR